MIVSKYIRLSDADEDTGDGDKLESNSIVNQRSLLDRYIATQEEFADCQILEFCDDGKSGTNLNRPGIQALLAMARRGEIDCVIVKDLSRLGRNHLDTGDLIEQVFPFLGIRLISVNDHFDSSRQSYGTAGNLDTGLRNLINELYSRDISQKSRTGKKQFAARGETVVSYPIYGYIKDPADKHNLLVDPVAAPAVQQIFAWFIEGVSRKEIASRLNAAGVASPMMRKQQLGTRRRTWNTEREKNEWSSDSLSRILRDEQYTGKLIYGKERRTVFGDPNSSRPQNPSEWIVIDGAFEAIVSQKIYDRAQAIINEKYRRKPRRGTEKSLFYRVLKCGICGLALERMHCKNPYYRCRGTAWNSDLGCKCVRIDEDELIQAVLESLRLQAQVVKKRILPQHKGTNHSDARNLQRSIDQLSAERKALYLRYNEGGLDLSEFRQESDLLRTKEKFLCQQLTALDAANGETAKASALNMESQRTLQSYENLNSLDRSVVEKLIQCIRVYEGNRIEIEWKFTNFTTNEGGGIT